MKYSRNENIYIKRKFNTLIRNTKLDVLIILLIAIVVFNCSNKFIILIIEMLEMFKYEFHKNEESYSIGKYSSIFSIRAKEANSFASGINSIL